MCHILVMGPAVYQLQSPLWPPWPPLPREGFGVQGAYPGAGQPGQRAEHSGESLCSWWLLDTGRVTVPSHPHPNSRTDLVQGRGAAQEMADRCE